MQGRERTQNYDLGYIISVLYYVILYYIFSDGITEVKALKASGQCAARTRVRREEILQKSQGRSPMQGTCLARVGPWV